MVFQMGVEEQLKLDEEIFANLRNRLANPETCDIPNQTTVRAMEQARKGKGKKYDSVEQMFADTEV